MTEEKILKLATTHIYKGWFDDDNVIEFAKAIQREALLEAADTFCKMDYIEADWEGGWASDHLQRMAAEVK